MSSDSIVFVIDYSIAIQSKTLALFLSNENSSLDTSNKFMKLPINSKRLNRIIDFMNLKFSNTQAAPLLEFKITDEETMDLLEIASYLRI
jgi:hypothetical protein